MNESNHIKLTDFGTAKILDDEIKQQQLNEMKDKTDEENNSRPVRRKNSFVGTAPFVAPEILQGKNPTISCDLWSFGCIIFQMLTGKHLFSGK